MNLAARLAMMFALPPADAGAARFAPPLDEPTAWELVALAVAGDDEASDLFESIARKSPAFLAWALVREHARSATLVESVEELRERVAARGFARFLLRGPSAEGERSAFSISPLPFDGAEFRRRLNEVLPSSLQEERRALDSRAAYDLAAALAPAFALPGSSNGEDPGASTTISWESLPLPAGWKRLWRRAALRHGIDEPTLERASIDAARLATTKETSKAVSRRARTDDVEEVPLAYRTLQRAAELALAQSRSEAEFSRRLDAERWASTKELAYGASHEINNPLANIASRAQALATDEADTDRLAKLRTIERQAFRAFTMIQNLTLVAEPPAPELSRFDWSAALDRFVAKWREEAAAKGIRLERSRPAASPQSIEADPSQTEVIFDELVRNAIEASPSGTRIVVEGPAPDAAGERNGTAGALLVEISDEGAGLSPVARERLFDPFYSGREAGRGQGFGLSKARRIAENHGGSLRCRDRSPRGLTIDWRMPASDSTS